MCAGAGVRKCRSRWFEKWDDGSKELLRSRPVLAPAPPAALRMQLALGLGLWQAKESCNGSFSARSQCWSALVDVLVFDNRVVVSKCTQLQVVRYC